MASFGQKTMLYSFSFIPEAIKKRLGSRFV